MSGAEGLCGTNQAVGGGQASWGVVLSKTVERTNAWILTYRRLWVDYEVLPLHSEGFIYLAMCRILFIRLAKCTKLVV